MARGLLRACWWALDHAQGETAVQFRERLQVFESQPVATADATGHFWDTHMQPWQLVDVSRTRLTYQEGRGDEALVQRCVHARGL
jgi:hypothetical protein